MNTIQAVFQGGVFRPVVSIDLPEGCAVEFEPRIVADLERPAALSAVYAILSLRFQSGDPWGAEHHDEHQP